MSLAAPAELNSELDELEKNVQPTWEGLLHPYEQIQDRLSKTWGAVSHLKVRRQGCLEVSRQDRMCKPRSVPHLFEFRGSSQDGLDLVT